MGIALRYIAAPVLAASVAVTIAAATASAMAEPQHARTVDASTASPDHGVVTVASSVALTTPTATPPVRPRSGHYPASAARLTRPCLWWQLPSVRLQSPPRQLLPPPVGLCDSW